MSDEKAKALGLQPLARIVASSVSGLAPEVMGVGPVPSTERALARTGLTIEDIGLFELNEAFAVQVLASADAIGMDYDKLNVNGGAIAIGHPLGASGARIATTLIHAMRDKKASLGLATMCIGAGQGIATVFEAV